MPRLILLPLLIIYCISASGQIRNALELSLVSRYDKHANYVTNFAGRAYNDTMKLFGLSKGVSVQFRKSLSPTYSIYFGAGYYRLGVDKIRNSMPFGIPGVSTGRSLNNVDDDSTRLGYSTSKYHYNNLSFMVGLSKLFRLNKHIHLDVGAEVIGYHTFSQRYKLMNGYHYKTTNARPLEFGINATVGLLKEFDKFYIRPALLLPVYQRLRGDRVFYEDKEMNISKWFNGAGLTVRIGKLI